MHISEFEKLLETRARRPLNDAETARLEQWFAEHPDDREIWEEEEALCGALDRLPDAPVSSNFTAQVWRRIELEARKPEREEGWLWRVLGGSWLTVPRLAWACGLVLIAGIVLQQRELEKRTEMAESIVPVAELAQLPTVEMLRDFDAINSLGEPMLSGDLELLAALEDAGK